MRAEVPGAEDKDAHMTEGVNDPRLRWYPRSWRARYGDELVTLLHDEYGERLPTPVHLGLVTGGLRQRARQSGLTGDSTPATDGVRAGALVVLAAWTAFVIAGASFAKFSEHFDEALPHAMGAHRVPDVAFTVLQTVAGLAGVLVVAGALVAVPTFVRFLRADGWACVRGHILRALACTAVTGCRHDASAPFGPPPHVTATQQRPALVRGALLGLGGAHRDHHGVVDGGRGCRGTKGRVSPSDSHRGGAPGRCHRRVDAGHARSHGGLVGSDGKGRARLFELQPGRRPRNTVGPLARRYGRSHGCSHGYGRGWRGPRAPRMDQDARWGTILALTGRLPRLLG